MFDEGVIGNNSNPLNKQEINLLVYGLHGIILSLEDPSVFLIFKNNFFCPL